MYGTGVVDFSRARDLVFAERQAFGAPRATLVAWAPKTVADVCGAKMELDGGADAWRSDLRRPAWSLYDLCHVKARVEGTDDDVERVLRLEVAFGGSPQRVGAFVWLMNSVVGVPAAYAWRARSVHAAHTFATRIFAETRRALARAVDTAPYR